MKKIDDSARIGAKTAIGEFAVIGKNVTIGSGCRIGNNVVIHENSTIGDKVRIDDNSVIGKQPMKARWSVMKEGSGLPGAKIADDVMIGSQVTIYAGSVIEKNVLVADSAAIRERVQVGDSTIVGRLVTIEQDTSIGKRCKLETGVYITAYSILEDYCFIAPMVVTSNDNFLGRTEERLKHFKGVTVKRGGRIGANAVILPGIVIGEDAVVGAGSVVTKNVETKQTVIGVPAKFFRYVPEEQLLENQNW